MQYSTGTLFLAAAFTLAGTSIIAGRLVCGVLGTFTITVISLFFALLGLLPLCGRGVIEAVKQMNLQDWGRLLLQALFGIFLFRVLLLQGLLYTSAGEAGLLTGATPALTALLAWIFLQEPLYPARCLGIGSTVIGVLIIQGLCSPGIEFSGEHVAGNLLVLGAALCESLFNILSRISSMKDLGNQATGTDPIVWTTLVVCMALLLCLGPALAEDQAAALMSLSITGWGALVWYGLFVTALAFICWYHGIKRCDVSVAAAFSGLMPLTAFLLSVLLLNEQLRWEHCLGGLLVILGMWLTVN
ncbi:MAG: carboxylate/amino acid/amine transporter [Sporomusa sp.]|jgi:drug/metabolite transporter (DMT)-like permease|nr:carboxylate/amino acid/amine transporter [Sporomusa sp.]